MGTRGSKPPAGQAAGWQFAARFRRNSFGWKSQPAITRIREAVREILAAARKDHIHAAEGAVLFLERVAPAIEHVDGSSGGIGNAVNRAIEELVPVIASAPAAPATRESWLQRLWDARRNDPVPYLESLDGYWGELCAQPAFASAWVERVLVEETGSPVAGELPVFFEEPAACLGVLFGAGRHEAVVASLAGPPHSWSNWQWGAKSLAALGRVDEALRFAEQGRCCRDQRGGVADLCEAILLAAGREEDAYRRYATLANRGTTYLATYRAIARKYPHKKPADLLADLVAAHPGEAGKWFATAKEAGLLAEALTLASSSPCDPKTLTRAARDFAREDPDFAVRAGLLALHWISRGVGYEISSADAWAAYLAVRRAAESAADADRVQECIEEIVASESRGDRLLRTVLGRELDREKVRRADGKGKQADQETAS